MAVREKYQSLIDLANRSGASNLQVTEEGEVLHVSGTVGSEEAGDSYTVKSGDTLSKIGHHHGVAWRDIHEANRDVIGDDPDKIKPGQKLRIPRK
jgi:nucleoid-associated protein YgaU